MHTNSIADLKQSDITHVNGGRLFEQWMSDEKIKAMQKFYREHKTVIDTIEYTIMVTGLTLMIKDSYRFLSKRLKPKTD